MLDIDSLEKEVVNGKKARAEAMPDEKAAISQLFEAYLRLKELGFKDAMHCPKDGSSFDAIEVGSTGIHECVYIGKWPEGSWNIIDDGELLQSNPVLFRDKK